ncbi:FKBP-type peptidyl-prolyl cis-trans isomerase [Gracilimonas mengyeensis]|uniref:Peptidyl-prolyl cis-trans isomerase n=1 Tax=Gracilimonas mengyeensis TaxID=1302730 RepID=A0A521AV94_9BACT|nr:peptidylprolyl isomerase [Gracilimonas mengyeensis]SMO38641.1 FKBP-type peptidyl-prolyl cis-trans isomerase 2 [Gracilimonas mengyeensis]
MSKVKDGDTVKVHYTGKLEDGSVFDSSESRDPLEVTLGEGKLIPGFEKAVVGLEVGDKTTANIPSEEAYGERRDDLEVTVERDQLPEDIEPEVGMQLQLNQPNGQPVPVQVTKVEEENIIIDANHPLAGKDLTFDIELIEIVN